MPAMTYRLRWPDATETDCYSPSLIIRERFEIDRDYPLNEFLARIREATGIASDRVQARYGFRCVRAEGQLREIERIAATFDDGGDRGGSAHGATGSGRVLRTDAVVRVVAFGDAAA